MSSARLLRRRAAVLLTTLPLLGLAWACADRAPGGGDDDDNNAANNQANNANNTSNNASNNASNNGPNNASNNATNNQANNQSNNAPNNQANNQNNANNSAVICEAGTTRCVDASTLETCSPDGTMLETSTCPLEQVCDAQIGDCAELICEPNAALGCQDTTLAVRCNALGTAREVERCPEEQRCVDGACLTGAGSCGGDEDCGDDHYCQVGICLPYGTGPRDENNRGCIQEPFEGAFAPAVQCRWEGGHVIMQPAVIDLNGDETPEIIFTWWNTNSHTQAFLTAIHGDNCQVFADAPTNAPLHGEASIAAGDIDNDGAPEIVGLRNDGILVAYDNNLQVQWTSAAAGDPGTWGGPAIVDLDQDGNPEVVHGGLVLNGEDGTVQFNAGQFDYGQGPLSAIADVDNDGQNEIVLGNAIIGPTGQIETPPLMAGLEPGHVAIADFDRATPEPEIVVVFATNRVRVQRHTGEVIFGPYQIPNPSGAPGGAPNVGDFDGDGMPEIGTAGGNNYAVFDLECAAQPLPPQCAMPGIRWLKPTRDNSSGSTGSSLFDFEGDGPAEVVYNDECYMRVYDGATGAARFAFANTTNTTFENPVVVDVDGDFNSEIVIPANNIGAACAIDAETGTSPGATRGIVVLRDVTDRWVNSRPIWNQHTYHVTNVEDNGRIPQVEQPGWRLFNHYRQNVQQEGKALNAPDLTANPREAPIQRAGCGAIDLRITVFNRGSQPVASGVPVSFFAGDPAQGGAFICSATTTTRLDPGQGEEVGCLWTNAPDAAASVYAVADALWDNGQIVERNTECVELNNWATVPIPACN